MPLYRDMFDHVLDGLLCGLTTRSRITSLHCVNSTQLKVYLPITENIEHNSTTPNGRLPERPKPI